MSASSQSSLLSLQEVGRLLNPDRPLGTPHLRRLIREGRPKAVQVGRYWGCTPQAVAAAKKRRAR
jgi:hypothetical protein